MARQLQQEWNEEIEYISSGSSKQNVLDSSVHATGIVIKDKQNVIRALSSKVEMNSFS